MGKLLIQKFHYVRSFHLSTKKASCSFFTIILLIAATSLKICKLSDPKRDECIKDSIQAFLPSLRNKVDNFDLQSIDPFSYESLMFNYKNSEAFVGSFNLKNVKTYGMSRGKVESVKSDFANDELSIQANLFFPKLFSTASYQSNVSLNFLQFISKGQYNLTLKDVKAKWNIKGKLDKKEDEELYMKVNKFEISFEADDLKISATGLLPDENLSEFIQIFN